jgi:hypothetical protein
VSYPLGPLPVSGVLASCRSGTGEGGNSRQTLMNTAHPCYLNFFGVTVSWTELRIRNDNDNDEVVGSIPTISTVFSRTGVAHSWGMPSFCVGFFLVMA